MTDISRTLTIPENLAGLRLDQALSQLLPDYSRTQIQAWIKNKNIKHNQIFPKTRTLVANGDLIEINAVVKEQPIWEAQAIALDIIHEDESIIIINKPIGLVVHPGAGNSQNTLLNALLHHAPALQKLPRAGIIHRLDKDTSGLMVIAKTQSAWMSLSKQLKDRTVSRIYQAVVWGTMTSGGVVEQPIGRHHALRTRMAISEVGKPAVTHYRVMERYADHTRIKLQLETGRTHQIRVHMAHIRHPVLGDQTYGGRLQLPKGASPELIQVLRQFKRQALHAFELGFIHPESNQEVIFSSPLPEDMQMLIEILRKENKTIR